MGFIGVQPTSAPLTSSDITDGIISKSKIANDAVDNTKLDLASDYAFTGTISGAGGGKVLQAVSSTLSSSTDTSSQSYADTGLSVAITPSATSSKILVFVSHTGLIKQSSNNAGKIELGRTISGGSYSSLRMFDNDFGRDGTTGLMIVGGASTSLLDTTHNTTSAITYKTRFACSVTAASTIGLQQNNCVASITAMEISA